MTWPHFGPNFWPQRCGQVIDLEVFTCFFVKALFFWKISLSLQKEEYLKKKQKLWNKGGQVIDLWWPSYWPYSMRIYIYIYIHTLYMCVYPKRPPRVNDNHELRARRPGTSVFTANMPKTCLRRRRKVFLGPRSESPKTFSCTVRKPASVGSVLTTSMSKNGALLNFRCSWNEWVYLTPGFVLEKNQERASKFVSILGCDRGLVNNCSAAARRAPNWTGRALNCSYLGCFPCTKEGLPVPKALFWDSRPKDTKWLLALFSSTPLGILAVWHSKYQAGKVAVNQEWITEFLICTACRALPWPSSPCFFRFPCFFRSPIFLAFFFVRFSFLFQGF